MRKVELILYFFVQGFATITYLSPFQDVVILGLYEGSFYESWDNLHVSRWVNRRPVYQKTTTRHYCYQWAKVKSAIETYDPSSQGSVSRRSHKFVFIQNGGFKSVENYTIKLAAKETKACFSILKLFILKYSFGHV